MKKKDRCLLVFILSLGALASCSDDNSDSQNASGAAKVDLVVTPSKFIPGRYYFNGHTISVAEGDVVTRKHLTVKDTANGNTVYQHIEYREDSHFPQVDLGSGSYSATLSVDVEEERSAANAPAQSNKVSQTAQNADDDYNAFATIVDQKVVEGEYVEIPIDDTSSISDCLVDQQCLVNTNGLCALPDDEPAVISCELSKSCQSIQLETLQIALNNGLEEVDCGRTLALNETTPLLLWAEGGSGVKGELNSYAGGDAGASGKAVGIYTLSHVLTHFSSNTFYYALGDDASLYVDNLLPYGVGGAATVVTAKDNFYIKDVLLVAGGGGGGENAGYFENGDAGYAGGIALSNLLTEATTGQGDGGTRGGGYDTCELYVDCGGSGENDGGNGIAGRGGESGQTDYRSRWLNISSDEFDEEGTFAYILYRSGGDGGNGTSGDVFDDSDGGGGGGHGGGGSGTSGDGGGGGGGSYAAASSILLDYVDMDALASELEEPVYGQGSIYLLWMPLKSTP